MNELLGREPGHISDSAERRIDSAAERVVSYLLMRDEFPLQDPVSGTSGFAEEFASRGRRDPQGRSLRDLDLNTRLFRYPCSYLIDSPAFDALPDEVRSRIVKRLKAILQDGDEAEHYPQLTPAMRSEILEILTFLKPEFRDGSAS